MQVLLGTPRKLPWEGKWKVSWVAPSSVPRNRQEAGLPNWKGLMYLAQLLHPTLAPANPVRATEFARKWQETKPTLGVGVSNSHSPLL